MKTMTLYKGFNPDQLYGGYFWSIDEVWDDWNHIYSDPYEVEIPDGFELGETMAGEKRFWKEGCKSSYSLEIVGNRKTGGAPYLMGGSPVEWIKLNVVRKIEDGEEAG